MSKLFSTKAQAGFEFIALIGFMFLIFVIFLGIVTQSMIDVQEEKNKKALIDLSEVLKKEIDLAIKAEPGYSRVFRLPPTINAINYSIEVQRGDLGSSISLQFKDFSSKFETEINIPHGVFAQKIGQGYNLIEKNQSIIVINKADIKDYSELMAEQKMFTGKETVIARHGQPAP